MWSLRLRSVTGLRLSLGFAREPRSVMGEVPFDSPSAPLRNHAQGTGGTRSLEENETWSLSEIETWSLSEIETRSLSEIETRSLSGVETTGD